MPPFSWGIKRINSDYLVIPEDLGQYIRPPHKNPKWTTNHKGTIAHSEVIINEMRCYIVYSLSSERGSRSGRQLIRMDGVASYPLQFYASIVRVDDDTVILHSWVPGYQTPAAPTSTLWQAIRIDGNQSLWRTLKCNGDGTLDWAGAPSWYPFGGTRRILYEGSGSGCMLCGCNDILHENKADVHLHNRRMLFIGGQLQRRNTWCNLSPANSPGSFLRNDWSFSHTQ